MFRLILTSVGNPDRGQDPYSTMLGTPMTDTMVASFAEASRLVRRYIRDHDLGSGNWPTTRLLDADGFEVAQISYNGVVWPPGSWNDDVSALYDPRTR